MGYGRRQDFPMRGVIGVKVLLALFVAVLVTFSLALLFGGGAAEAQEEPAPSSEPAPASSKPALQPSGGGGGATEPASEPEPAPEPAPSEPAPEPAPEPVASEPAPTSSAADGLAASLARVADEVVERVTDMVKALLNADKAASNAVMELMEQLGDVVSALLGGNGASWSGEDLIGHVASVVSKMAQAVAGVLGALLGGEDGVPAAPPDYYHLVTQPLAAFYHYYELPTAELVERATAATDELAKAVGVALRGAGVAPNQEPAGVPAPPPAAPPLVPVAPRPVAPGGYSSSFLGASGSAADAFQLLFAVLVVLSVAVLKGGRLSWLGRKSHGPPTAIVLAIERPG